LDAPIRFEANSFRRRIVNTAIAPILLRQPAPLDSAATDAELLSSFIAERDDAAFAAIVARHGRMVLGVCRRVASDPHDAEDAFQATFLVLAVKAAKVRPPEMLGAWLYGVAYRTAQKARCNTARRRETERRAAAMNANQTTTDQRWDDLRPVLDEELNRLPARYRSAIVACDLEGKPRHDAADELRVNPGTLSSRLARGRELLAARLTRRGVALSAGALAALLASDAATAAPATALVSSTVQAGVAMSAKKRKKMIKTFRANSRFSATPL
jgi:RNA polymerase sigma factor (sigma-70 family)